MPYYNPTIHHRRSIRLKGYDYSQAGMYFVTICCQNHMSRFGQIENGKMMLNDAGKIAYNEWYKTCDIRSNVQLDAFVVMPNHIHGIIVITDDGRGVSHTPNNEPHTPITPTNAPHTSINELPINELPINELSINELSINELSINELPNGNSGVSDTPLRSPSNTIGAIVRGYKSAVTKQLNQLGFTHSVWQRNYFEIIISNKQSYQYIANYIINNPMKWKNDKFLCKIK
jgi:REP element-mobilizing transposase RayT